MPSTQSSAKPLYRLSFEAIGTQWHIDTNRPIPADTLVALFDAIASFDHKWSRFRGDSRVAALSRTPGSLALDKDEYDMWHLYSDLYQASDGAISPFVGLALEAAGYDMDYSLVRHRTAATIPAWTDAVELTPSMLVTRMPLGIDIGAAGKGLLVDRIAALLQLSCDSFVVDASGDILVHNHAEAIALEHPHDHELAIGTVQLRDGALCGSAPNRRAWTDTHHIIDARSGKATTETAATWALAETAMRADMAATALFFLSPARLLSLIDCRYIVMPTGDEVRYSTDRNIEIYA